MTKQEVLDILSKRRDAIKHEAYLLRERDKNSKTMAAFGPTDAELLYAAELSKESATIAWAYALVRQIDEPKQKSRSKLPSNEQNTVAAGWQAAITGELKQKR